MRLQDTVGLGLSRAWSERVIGAGERARERERFWFGLVCMCVSECWPSALVLSVRERIIFYG